MTHVVDGDTAAGWTRHYETFSDSNRLHYTWTGSNRTATEIEYHYDTHGSMLNFMNAAPGQDLLWDHRDMIASIDLKGGGRVFYQYDAGKQRTRKYLDHGIIEERLYLGGYELYRRSDAGGVVEEIESQHLFVGEERVLLVEDVISTDNANLATGPLFRYQYSNHLGSACLELRDDAAFFPTRNFIPMARPPTAPPTRTSKCRRRGIAIREWSGMTRAAPATIRHGTMRSGLDAGSAATQPLAAPTTIVLFCATP
jgi:hypothetical protein